MTDTKFLVMDVDGTLTDGKIYMGQNGELAKVFDIKDGCGILLELPLYDITPIIITARESNILKNRCDELKITELYQGVKNKLATLLNILEEKKCDLSSVAYAGDDLPDIPCMEAIKKAGGIVMCPSDAIPEIRSLANYISGFKAGEGAIRDMIRYLGGNIKSINLQQQIDDAVAWLLSTDFSTMNAGTYKRDDGSSFSVQEYNTKNEDDCVLESHHNHIDIQYMVQGNEIFKIYSTFCLESAGEYNEVNDVEYWSNGQTATQSILVPGSIIVVHNGQPHKGSIRISESDKVKKIVYKIKV